MCEYKKASITSFFAVSKSLRDGRSPFCSAAWLDELDWPLSLLHIFEKKVNTSYQLFFFCVCRFFSIEGSSSAQIDGPIRYFGPLSNVIYIRSYS